MARAQNGESRDHSGFIRDTAPTVCYPSYVPRMELILGTQRSEVGLALERLTGLGGMLSGLLNTMVYGEDSLCYSNVDSAEELVEGRGPRSERMLGVL